MCMICNVVTGADGVDAANRFLYEYAEAQCRMKAATDALLKMKQHVGSQHARHYDRMHKRMKAIMRDWNMIEHQREQYSATSPSAAAVQLDAKEGQP